MTMLLTIFASFLKIGAFTFGGGYAMLPLREREVIDRRAWV
ncbi:MAG: chromate transporter, partial [Alistipes sp.]|nr:chromate transporter [Alistipes sp.]